MHFFAKCNSGRIAIQWFHIKHYLDFQCTKFQPYTSRVQKMCVFARYATLVPRLLSILNIFNNISFFSEIQVDKIYGPKLTWANFVMGRNDPEPWGGNGLGAEGRGFVLTRGRFDLHPFRCFPVNR